MPVRCAVRRKAYFDSVFLMRAAARISAQPGVRDVAALMGTPANKALLAEGGFTCAEVALAGPNDLLVAVRAETEELAAGVLARLDEWLRPEPGARPGPRARTLEEAIRLLPDANLAVISVPGEHAAREARLALERGLHVFLFSDNVPLAQEVPLKEEAQSRGLLVMGPDCGTAIIAGVGVGFANAVRRGPIGVVGASGTGMQEVTTLVHRAGSGISHAIGTGSNDPTDAVGAVTTLMGLDALERDAATRVIVVVSKPPGERSRARIAERIARCAKPVVTCFLGEGEHGGALAAGTIDDAAALAIRAAGGAPSALQAPGEEERVLAERRAMLPRQRYVRGLFAGGSFCYQAQHVLREAGLAALSNAPLRPELRLADARRGVGHALVDLGADEFTRGRPHPMIDSRLRRERLLAEAEDPTVAVVLLDFLLGYGCAPDPAGDLADAIARAKRTARGRGGHLAVVASVCGTEDDPQGFERQVGRLREVGALVSASAAGAARLAASLVA